jgi:hypothetical protein
MAFLAITPVLRDFNVFIDVVVKLQYSMIHQHCTQNRFRLKIRLTASVWRQSLYPYSQIREGGVHLLETNKNITRGTEYSKQSVWGGM